MVIQYQSKTNLLAKTLFTHYLQNCLKTLETFKTFNKF